MIFTLVVQQMRVQHVYDFAPLDRVPDGPTSATVSAKRLLSSETLQTGKSSTVGVVLAGSHIIVTLGRQAQGSGAKAHTHPNEQFTLVVEGELEGELAGERMRVGERCMLHVPAGTAHSLTARNGALVVTAQDARHAFTA